MMRIKIKANGRRFTIPVPYAVLHLGISVLTSKRVLALANRSIEKAGKKNIRIPQIDKSDLKPLLRELSKQKGLMLVETSLKDGTEVSIKL